MNEFSYWILVEVPATGAMQDLAKALQTGYDNGADGQFRVVSTREPGYMVTFLRTVAEDDLQHLRDRMKQGSQTLQLAAMHQLAAELQDGGVGKMAGPVVEDLRNGDAQIVDFNGVFSTQPEDTHEMSFDQVDSSRAENQARAPVIVILKTNCAPVVNEVFANTADVTVIFLDEDTEGGDVDSIHVVEGENSWVGIHEAEQDVQRTASICRELQSTPTARRS